MGLFLFVFQLQIHKTRLLHWIRLIIDCVLEILSWSIYSYCTSMIHSLKNKSRYLMQCCFSQKCILCQGF